MKSDSHQRKHAELLEHEERYAWKKWVKKKRRGGVLGEEERYEEYQPPHFLLPARGEA